MKKNSSFILGKEKKLIIVAYLLFISSLVAISHFMSKSTDKDLEIRLRQEAVSYFSHFEESLIQRLYALDRMANRFKGRGENFKKDWMLDAKDYYEHFRGFQAVEWADNSSQLQWIYPLKGNEAAIGLVLNKEGRRDEAINYAIKMSQGALTKAITLKQGGRGFLSLHPAIRNGKRNGYIIGVYRANDIISLFSTKKLNLKVNLEGEQVYNSFEKTSDLATLSNELKIRNITFKIWVQPSIAFLNHSKKTKTFRNIIFFGLFIFGSMIFYLLNNYQRKKREQESIISEQNTYLNLALEGANLGIWDWYLTDNSVRFDRRWAEMLGIDYETIKMDVSTWESRVHPDDLDKCYEDIQAYLNGESEYYHNIHRMKHSDGRWVYILDQGKVSKSDLNGKPIRFTGTHLDITKQKEQEIKLLEAKIAAESAERAKSDFLANMSHEIRTPMNGVIGMLQLLEETELTKDQKEMLGTTRSCGNDLMALLNDILDISKIESGKVNFENINFDIYKCITEAISLTSFKSSEKEIDVSFAGALDKELWLVGDVTRVKQIVTNYLSNAIKFTEKGVVTVDISSKEIDSDKYRVIISVRDTGIGIPKESQSKLFEAFSQADTSTTRLFGGTGLGLSICSKLASAMRGRVWFESELGQGSTFFVELDFKKGKKEEVAFKNINKKVINSSKKVLIAEDNIVNQKIARMMLKKVGLNCDIANNGLEALDALKKKSFDIIFMDMQMPIMDGITATSKIISKYGKKAPPIVAMTANAFEEDRRRCKEVGMVDFISKPILMEELTRVLNDTELISRIEDECA
jgi:PAS domain S-box-containing protein